MFKELLITTLILASGAATAPEIPVARFSASDLSGWSDKKVKGKTAYTLEDGALKAHAVKGATAKIKKFEADTKKYQRLTWRWRVDHTLAKEDVKTKEGDDFAARVYVIFPRSFFRMRAINYVWAAKMPKESVAPSPYTKNSVIIAVESGDEKAGKWVSEERNIYEDYRKAFGEDPPLLGGIAIMTDTDDTQEEATAWYGDITMHAVARGNNAGSAMASPTGHQKHPGAPSPAAGKAGESPATPPAAQINQPSSSTSSSASGGATPPPR